MKNLTFIRQAACQDCGTGYGESGPLGVYQCADETVLICDECYATYDLEDESETEDDQ